MVNKFVNYEISLELKKIGFNEPCFGYYEYGNFIYEYNSYQEPELLLNCSAPLYQDVFDWFETKHKLFANIDVLIKSQYKYKIKSLDSKVLEIDYTTFNNGECKPTEMDIYIGKDESFETKREAEISCILKMIELIG